MKRVDSETNLNFLKHHPQIIPSAKKNNIDILMSNKEYLSCYVRHFGSHSRLSNYKNSHQVRNSKIKLIRNGKVKNHVDTEWHFEYIERFFEITNSLKSFSIKIM